MRTIKSVMAQMTDVKTIMQNMRDTLSVIDSTYLAEEAKFLQAASKLETALGYTVSPSAGEFLAAMEQEFVSGVIYVGWLGFKLRHDCYYNPINALILKQDYEDILQERRLHTLPMAQKAIQVIDAFCKQKPTNVDVEVDIIINFYSYLHSVGYKLAHYFGFLLADELLYYLIPGYTRDSVITAQYAAGIKSYLNLRTEEI